jgi:hypothetical protein
MLVSPLQPCSHSIPRKEYSLRTLSESSRLVTPRGGGFFNRRYGIVAPAVTLWLIFLFESAKGREAAILVKYLH